MLNALNSVLDYLKDHLVLTIILGIIAVLIVALIIAMIVIGTKAKKLKKAEGEASPVEEEAPAEEPAPVKEEPKQEPAPVAQKEEPTPKEEPKKEPAPVKEEPKKEEPKKKEAQKKAPAKKEEPTKPVATGKWIIRREGDKYSFDLVASNGEVMISSSVPYSTLSSAKSGIQTYKNNIAAGKFNITETKNGDFIFQLLNARGALLASGNAYRTRANCENAIESTKRWAQSDTIEVRD